MTLESADSTWDNGGNSSPGMAATCFRGARNGHPFFRRIVMNTEYEPQIVPATPADCVDIAIVNRNSLIAAYTGVAPAITEETLRYHTNDDWLSNKTNYYQNCIREGAKLSIAKIGEKAIGFALIGREYALYVLPEYHGSTVGLRLLNDVATEIINAKNLKKITFTVVPGTAAVKFYDQLGCKPTGRDISTESPTLRGGQALPLIEMEMTRAEAVNSKRRIDALLARRTGRLRDNS